MVRNLLHAGLRTNIIRENVSDDVLSGKIVVKILVIVLHVIPQFSRFEWIRVIKLEAFSEKRTPPLVFLTGRPKESRDGRAL
jgi:hypothetical protein